MFPSYGCTDCVERGEAAEELLPRSCEIENIVGLVGHEMAWTAMGRAIEEVVSVRPTGRSNGPGVSGDHFRSTQVL